MFLPLSGRAAHSTRSAIVEAPVRSAKLQPVAIATASSSFAFAGRVPSMMRERVALEMPALAASCRWLVK
nr:hypothetical protein [Rhodococcus sp. YL-0]